MKKHAFWLLSLTFLVFACSKDDGPAPNPVQDDPVDDPVEVEVLTGVFKDAEVQGLTYETATQNGLTNAAGEFNYVEGETVTFKLGDLTIGSAQGQALVTPLTLAPDSNSNAKQSEKGINISFTAKNIAALLQTLDDDQDHSNGISISADNISKMGIATIDFSKPIENILADIVLNIAQNGGASLDVIYPEQAASNMAEALGMTYEAQPMYAITHLMPTLKVFLTSSFNQNVSNSAVYKNTFDESGNLVSTEVISRYSGTLLFKIDYDSHAEDGQPATGSYSLDYSLLPNGTFPPNEPLMIDVILTYDDNHHLILLERFRNAMDFGTPLIFEGYAESGKGMSDANMPGVMRNEWMSEDGYQTNANAHTFTYLDGNLASEDVTSLSEGTNPDNPYSYSSTTSHTYSYDGTNNLSEKTYANSYENNYTYDGVAYTNSGSTTESISYGYRGNHTLESRTGMGNYQISNGKNPVNYSYDHSFDDDELIKQRVYTADNGFERVIDYAMGVVTNITESQDGMQTFEEEFFSDGSRISKWYYYDENSELSSTYTRELNADFITTKETVEYYVAGTLDATYVYTYSSNGILDQTTVYNADGSIRFIDYYNENGQRIKTDFYTDGAISSTQEFGYNADGYINQVLFKDANGEVTQINNYMYDANGFVQTVEVLFGDGSPWINEVWEYDENGYLSKITGTYFDDYYYILYYEQAVLVLAEYYDPNGVLYDSIDYTNSGKSMAYSIRKPSKNVDYELRTTDFEYGVVKNPVKMGIRTKVLTETRNTTNEVLSQHLKNVHRFKLYRR